MPNLTNQAHRIQWYEGMLLLPQHFQQADQRIDYLFNFHQANGISHYWGIIDCQIDESRLSNGYVSVLSLEAVLPDGTPFTLLPENRASFNIDLNKLFGSSDRELTIYLALPEYFSGHATVNNDLPRFLPQQTPAQCDENVGTGGDRLPILRPNAMLLINEPILQRCVSFPLLKIIKQGHDYVLNTKFYPPQLKLTVNSPLNRQGKILLKKVRDKINFLINRMSDQEGEDLSNEASRRIDCLSGGLLSFEAILQAGASHPFHVYLLLCNLANNVASLQKDKMLPVFKTYDHNDLYSTFNQIFDYVDSHLDTIQENYALIHFNLQDRFFKLALQPDWKCDQMIVYAKAHKNMSINEMVEWINTAVIASDSTVTAVRDKRILGAKRKIVSSNTETKFLGGKDSLLFTINCQSDFINFDENINIFNIADNPNHRPSELIFYKVKGA